MLGIWLTLLMGAGAGRSEDAAGPLNLLKDFDQLFIQTPPGAQVERKGETGLKVVYTVPEPPPSKDLWLSVKRVFKPSTDGNAVVVETPGFERSVLVNVWNDVKQKAFRDLRPNDDRVVDLYRVGFRGSGGQEFSGKVHAVEIALHLSKLPGEHTVEIERFELNR